MISSVKVFIKPSAHPLGGQGLRRSSPCVVSGGAVRSLLGIRQVPEDLVEAARSFGASPRQLLFKVQLPLAMPTIMAGLTQCIMLSLSMVVIAALVGAAGLGVPVVRALNTVNIARGFEAGLAIVILAIILDRMTQAVGQARRDKGTRHWYENGPVGLLEGKKAYLVVASGGVGVDSEVDFRRYRSIQILNFKDQTGGNVQLWAEDFLPERIARRFGRITSIELVNRTPELAGQVLD